MQPLARPATDPTRDLRLWQIAKRRAKFQGHLLVYVLVNAGLWALYFLLPEAHGRHSELPWPIWTSVFWGIAVAAQGLCAYSGLNRGERAQREYERLLAQQGAY
ncbi:2TM domain-containing protein [Hymenobacter sp. RP-2-7]|uniref:2TM domain-containing protein n=1 Tax=Hymenobacter polaris TaxID=2682546 RepID=A0A7Y0AIB5_9BACT|nr:2TM domain-containing protein [Hymenobacter polaris]NML67824.1 2TM domain-containing protein [Hymenobacter polaris]